MSGVSRVLQGELAREGRALERKLNELQGGILEVRMVPLEQVFDKLARLVRKIARDAGKELDLKVTGGDVELDKLIVEELSDPLMHLIRNAIDHGIERPEARVKAGKSRRGLIALDAVQKGNQVEIAVSDDGAGIDVERVRAVAVERGLVSASAAEELSQRELFNFLFTPGFSTASQVSELSGRGVGMDVVKTNIANLWGSSTSTPTWGAVRAGPSAFRRPWPSCGPFWSTPATTSTPSPSTACWRFWSSAPTRSGQSRGGSW